jgi:hypothetical protein
MKKNEGLRDPWKEKYFGPIDKSQVRMVSPEEKAKMDAENKRFSDALEEDMKRINRDPKLNAMLGRKKVKSGGSIKKKHANW